MPFYDRREVSCLLWMSMVATPFIAIVGVQVLRTLVDSATELRSHSLPFWAAWSAHRCLRRALRRARIRPDSVYCNPRSATILLRSQDHGGGNLTFIDQIQGCDTLRVGAVHGVRQVNVRWLAPIVRLEKGSGKIVRIKGMLFFRQDDDGSDPTAEPMPPQAVQLLAKEITGMRPLQADMIA